VSLRFATIVDLGFSLSLHGKVLGMSQFGTEPGKSGFNDLTKEYKKSPTIENYVRLRREHPEGEVEVSTTGGVEFLFAQEKELSSYGLDSKVVVSSSASSRSTLLAGAGRL
jgi:hypothetical protein